MFLSIWNSHSTCLSFSIIRVCIFSSSKCPNFFDCSTCSLILDYKKRSYPITFSNTSHQPLFAPCMLFEVCHANPPHHLQLPQQIIDGPLSQVQKWRIWCGWHFGSTSHDYNLLLQRSLRLPQCIWIVSFRELISTVATGGLPISMISSIPSKLFLSDNVFVPVVTCASMLATESWG